MTKLDMLDESLDRIYQAKTLVRVLGASDLQELSSEEFLDYTDSIQVMLKLAAERINEAFG